MTIRQLIALLALFAVHPVSAWAEQPILAAKVVRESPQMLPLTDLTVVDGRRRTHKFKVQVARTPEQQEIGLMWRRKLPANEGMLFVFPQPKLASFWMRNTPTSLDLIFIRSDGTVANIEARAKPQSLDLIRSKGYVVAVLEVVAGKAKQLGLSTGDRVCHADLPPCQIAFFKS
jgi:uncharacterized protein